LTSIVWIAALCLVVVIPARAELPLETIKLPHGFKIELYASDIPNARSMTLGEKGTLFVGSRTAGNVYAIRDENNDAKADKIYVIARGLNMPNGVAFRDGSLYVAEVSRVLRFDQIEARLAEPPEPVVINSRLPDDKWHGWKFIRFSPEGKLFVPVGAPCNVCEREDERYASLMVMEPDGSDLKVWAKGVRNTVGFDWHPKTGELWFTDNGRDRAGDNFPPDELNRAPNAGMHFGFPYCHGKGHSDPEFGDKFSCDGFTPAALELGPHVAALGMRFYTGKMFPPEYRNQIFIAEHGSWNRSTPLGYRIMLVTLKDDTPLSYGIFAEGWLKPSGQPWGRPVDVQVMSDGALLVSDDFANAIYRISYTE
jgi:glucose/arabinose dehydrogenase